MLDCIHTSVKVWDVEDLREAVPSCSVVMLEEDEVLGYMGGDGNVVEVTAFSFL